MEINKQDKREVGNDEQEVVIKLKRGQIPYLLGAARLGILVQTWCARLWYAQAGRADEHLLDYRVSVGNTIKEIKEQTNIDEETAERGYLEVIDDFVTDQCKTYETEGILRWYEEEGKQLAAEQSRNHPGVVSFRPSEEVKSMAENYTKEIMDIICPKDDQLIA